MKNILLGSALVVLGIATVFLNDMDITVAIFMIPVGIGCMFSKEDIWN